MAIPHGFWERKQVNTRPTAQGFWAYTPENAHRTDMKGKKLITIEMNRLDENGKLPKGAQEVYMLFSNGRNWVRDWMKETLKLRSPEHQVVNGVRYTWIVPKSKRNLAVSEALKLDSHVVVYQTFNKTVKCASKCKTAENLVEECVCSCMGKFHGGRKNDKSKLQATVALPDFTLHIHGQYVEMRTEYMNGKVISKRIRNDEGIFVDVTEEFETEK